MFWALISPFRHTSQPPQLSPTSPLRIFFESYGRKVARHPLLAIVLSVTFSVLLSYPFLFIHSNTKPGSHHVWTSARTYHNPTTVPDIGMKQAWVQGSFMGALTEEVLEEGLKIQEALLGPSVSCVSTSEAGYYVNPANDHTLPPWMTAQPVSSVPVFLHSPLLYWNCSLKALQEDNDILATVNHSGTKHSSANVTMRFGSVFAGKKFEHQKLVAADALVISLFYKVNSSMGELWDQRAERLQHESQIHERYDIYGNEGKSTLYEFRFQPMSTFDIILLTGCYLFAAAYLVVSLRRLRAVKSRLGLVITVITEIVISISATFTILALFQMPVSRIPREVFPFVVIVIGLENMFRLINAVLATPAEQPTASRISAALGEVGFLSLVAVATDLGILFIIWSFSVSAVREFCLFAGVALLIDFGLHMTYFLAVLSVDVRRLELQDSLDKLNLSSEDLYTDNADTPSRTSWDQVLDFFFKGGSPLSTRIAGSAIMVCFAATLNMHFLDNRNPWSSIQEVFRWWWYGPRSIAVRSMAREVTNMPLNIARSPGSWMRAQDQETGMELIRAVNPGAVRLIARAYEPLFFVLAGSNRDRLPSKMPNVLGALDIEEFMHHIYPFALTLVVVVAVITLLMNHLLLKDLREDMGEPVKEHGPLLTTQTLCEGHSLDVAVISSSPKGVLASVGLDRRIVIWKLDGNGGPPTKDILRPTCSEHVLWPAMALALDERGDWLAIAPRAGRVSFYQVNEGRFSGSISVDLQGRPPSAFFFAPKSREDQQYGPRLIALRSDGTLFEIYIKTSEIFEHRICQGVVVSSSQGVFPPRLPLRIVTACQRGRIFITSKPGGQWSSYQLTLMAPPITSPIVESGEPCTIQPLSALGMFVSARSCNVDLVDLSESVICSFQIGQFKPSSLRAFHAKRRTCLYCGCPSVLSFSIAYTERESGMFMMHTYTSSRGRMRDICLRAERDRRERKCSGFESVEETTHWLEHVEGWEPTDLNMVAGIRRRELPTDDQSSADDYDGPPQNTSLRRRKKKGIKPVCDDEDEWEAWTMDANGVVVSYPLNESTDSGSSFDYDGLLVSHAGPVVKLGQRSVAIGFGNMIKVLFVGNERFENEDNTDPYQTLSRRPKGRR